MNAYKEINNTKHHVVIKRKIKCYMNQYVIFSCIDTVGSCPEPLHWASKHNPEL